MADPSLGPAVVQHGGLLAGAAAAASAAGTSPGAAAGTAVAAVGALRVPVSGRATAAHVRATEHAAAAATPGHRTAGGTRRRMIVVVRAVAVASGRRAQVWSGRVRERGAPVAGAARAAVRVTGPGVVVAAPRQATRGLGRRRGDRGRRTSAARRGRGQAVVAAADHRARHAPGRARSGLRVRVVRARLGRPELVAPGRWVRVPRRAPGRRRFLALLPPALSVQLLLFHGAHRAHGQPERGGVMTVGPESVHAGRARG